MKNLAPSIWNGGFETDGVLKAMMAVNLKMGKNYLQFLAVSFGVVDTCFINVYYFDPLHMFSK